jgi:hypothetical protein
MTLDPAIPTVAESIPGCKATAWHRLLLAKAAPEPIRRERQRWASVGRQAKLIAD